MRLPCHAARLPAVALLLVALVVTAATPAAAAASSDDRIGGSRPEVVSTLLADVLGVGGARLPQRVVLYEVGVKGQVDADLDVFRDVVATTLRDVRGWNLDDTIGYIPVQRDGDVRIWLASPAAVEAAHPACSRAYSCRVADNVYINAWRWHNGSDTFRQRSLDAYRRYVVNHEFGHWLGLDHRECRAGGAPAWVMQQQTISVGECEPRVWPQRDERLEARRNLLRR